jgi:Ca2+-binding RTX toxin-like protein
VLLLAGLASGCEPTGGIVKALLNSNNVTFGAADGHDNELTITVSGDDLVIADAADEITPDGNRCTSIDAHTVRCTPADAGPFAVRADLGDGNDTGTNNTAFSVGMSGGPGNDTLEGGSGVDTFDGGPGLDLLNGNGGDDRLEDGSPGILDVDVFNGGDGIDQMSYRSDNGVVIDLDGAADDGLPREHDRVGADVENIVGTTGEDRLVGNARANDLTGNDGDDVLIGGAGFDELFGGDGTDTCDLGRGGGSAFGCEA